MNFDHGWARELVRRSAARLDQEMAAVGRGAALRELLPFVVDPDRTVPFGDLAKRFRVSEAAVKVAMSRLRMRFGVFVREEVSRG